MALSVPPGEIALAPGASRDVPVTVTRLNGSAGPLTFTATGLPAGVTAAFTGTTLRLTAAVNAPRTPLDVPRDITITATPGNGDVAPAPRTVKLPARVMRPFLLSGPDTVAVPACGGLDVALKLERDRAYTGTIKLAAKNLPTGVTATFEPGPDIPAGGPVNVDVRMRLTAAGDVAPGKITVEADAQPIQIDLAMAHTARITYPGTRLIAPRKLGPGGLVNLDGDFCAGSRVRVGTAETDATLEGRTLSFRVPRLATSGPLTILPPGGTPVRRHRRGGGHVPLGGRAAVRELPLRRLLLRGGAGDVRRRRPAHADQRVLAVRHLQRDAADPGPDRGGHRPDPRPDPAVHGRALLRHRPGGAGLGGEPGEPAALHGRHRVLRHQDRRA